MSAETKNMAQYQNGAFVGISHLFFIGDSNGNGFGDDFDTTGKNVKELPVAQDGGFTYNGGTPSIDHYKVHGIAGDWSSRMTPGETEIREGGADYTGRLCVIGAKIDEDGLAKLFGV